MHLDFIVLNNNITTFYNNISDVNSEFDKSIYASILGRSVSNTNINNIKSNPILSTRDRMGLDETNAYRKILV